MTIRISTGLTNFLAKDGSLRKAFEDGALFIYTGSQPADADNAIGSVTQLCKITKGAAALVAGTRSIAKVASVKITGSPTTGQTSTVTINDVGYNIAEVTGNTIDQEIARLIAVINEQKDVLAVPVMTADTNFTEAGIVIMSLRNGVSFTITVTDGSGLTLTLLDDVVASSRGNGLQLGAVSDGTIAKDAEEWSGTNDNTGTAGWWRFVANPADDTLASQTLLRMDGSIGASSGDLIMPTAFQAGAKTTLIGANFTVPENA